MSYFWLKNKVSHLTRTLQAAKCIKSMKEMTWLRLISPRP